MHGECYMFLNITLLTMNTGLQMNLQFISDLVQRYFWSNLPLKKNGLLNSLATVEFHRLEKVWYLSVN